MIEVLAAAALAAPCKPPEGATVLARNRQAVVYRVGGGVHGCTRSGRTRLDVDRLIGLSLAGDRVAVATGRGGRKRFSLMALAVFRLPSAEVHSSLTIRYYNRAYGRVVRMRLHRSGTLAYAIQGGPEHGIHVLRRKVGSFALDRRANAALGSLQLTGNRFRWSYRGQPFEVAVDAAPPGPPPDCSVPPGAIAGSRFPPVFTLQGARAPDDSESATYGCLPGGRPLLLETGHASDVLEGSQKSVDVAAVRAPFVALDVHESYFKGSSSQVRVRDLRDGSTGAVGCGRSWYYAYDGSGQLARAVLSATGRVGCAIRHYSEGEHYATSVESAGAGEERVEHDNAADVDAGSLRVEGDQLVWMHDGDRRSAAFP